jgi:hypothetical protein
MGKPKGEAILPAGLGARGAHLNSITPKRSRRIPVTTAETSSEPPQPSLLEKKMNTTI